MKKYKKIVIYIIMSVLVIILVMIIYNENRHVSKYHEEKFLKNLDNYNMVAEIYYKDYEKHNIRTMEYSNATSGTIYIAMTIIMILCLIKEKLKLVRERSMHLQGEDWFMM